MTTKDWFKLSPNKNSVVRDERHGFSAERIDSGGKFFGFVYDSVEKEITISSVPLINISTKKLNVSIFWGYPSFNLETLPIKKQNIDVSHKATIDIKDHQVHESKSGISGTAKAQHNALWCDGEDCYIAYQDRSTISSKYGSSIKAKAEKYASSSVSILSYEFDYLTTIESFGENPFKEVNSHLNIVLKQNIFLSYEKEVNGEIFKTVDDRSYIKGYSVLGTKNIKTILDSSTVSSIKGSELYYKPVKKASSNISSYGNIDSKPIKGMQRESDIGAELILDIVDEKVILQIETGKAGFDFYLPEFHIEGKKLYYRDKESSINGYYSSLFEDKRLYYRDRYLSVYTYYDILSKGKKLDLVEDKVHIDPVGEVSTYPSKVTIKDISVDIVGVGHINYFFTVIYEDYIFEVRSGESEIIGISPVSTSAFKEPLYFPESSVIGYAHIDSTLLELRESSIVGSGNIECKHHALRPDHGAVIVKRIVPSPYYGLKHIKLLK